mmetsp:Transcript_32225/g.76556  ORF Transcript_32225/g.76556 Transcript_32225/m.76556 type:complete len:233 (-) Transcript_32225:11749-12447(-)
MDPPDPFGAVPRRPPTRCDERIARDNRGEVRVERARGLREVQQAAAPALERAAVQHGAHRRHDEVLEPLQRLRLPREVGVPRGRPDQGELLHHGDGVAARQELRNLELGRGLDVRRLESSELRHHLKHRRRRRRRRRTRLRRRRRQQRLSAQRVDHHHVGGQPVVIVGVPRGELHEHLRGGLRGPKVHPHDPLVRVLINRELVLQREVRVGPVLRGEDEGVDERQSRGGGDR